jgi:hypothetical protein
VRHPVSLLAALAVLPVSGAVRFAEHTIAADLKGGYQVIAADLNRDGKPDLIALASGMKELVWFENPGWTRHVIAGGQSRMINCVLVEPASGGAAEIVLASEFSNEAAKSAGVVAVLRSGPDPRQPWTATEIDRLPTSHRLRLAGVAFGRIVVNAPLTAADATPPDYRGRTPLVYYRPGEWKRRLISDANQGVMHGLAIVDWDGDGFDDVLTASFSGIHLFRAARDGRWTHTEIARGDPAPWPKSGASDVAVGHLGKTRFLAAIEPWHGEQVAVYLPKGKRWERQVIDRTLVDGHTILAADLEGTGRADIVAGYRGKGRSVYLYRAEDRAGKRWTRQTVDDGGIAAAACIALDLNGDGRPDLACIGSATANLKWYENRGK